MTGNTEEIAGRLKGVRRAILAATRASGRSPEAVTLVAVSKTHSVAEIREAARAGQRDFGESYVQEALRKIRELNDADLVWHFIGPVQSNKTRDIAAHFQWVHSVDRRKVAKRLSEQRPPGLPPLNVCIQINISGETQKGGIQPEQAEDLCKEVARMPNLRLRGLMTIPAPPAPGCDPHLPFRRLRRIAEGINARGIALDTLSMGMSSDMDSAIREGATIVRVGTAIFGNRGR